jgi:hypothetical protein
MATLTLHRAIVFDDGEFFVRYSGPNEKSPSDFPGFLRRRCCAGANTPDGYECVGGFDCDSAGRWCASINVGSLAGVQSDARELGRFATWVDAIHVLWDHRHEACPRPSMARNEFSSNHRAGHRSFSPTCSAARPAPRSEVPRRRIRRIV